MREFIFNGCRFHGFDKDFTIPHRLVLVQDEDVFDVFAADAVDWPELNESIDELLRYFTVSGSQAKIIGGYQEQGFLGVLVANKFVSNLSRFK